jgi:hypothetical protein
MKGKRKCDEKEKCCSTKILFANKRKSALAFLELSATLLQLNELAVHVANGLLTLGKARLNTEKL